MKTTALLLWLTIVAVGDAAERFPLWSEGEVPKSADIRAADGVVIYPIKPSGSGSSLPPGWMKGVDVAWHKGVLFASFGSNVNFATQGENSPGESAVYLTSKDGGSTWGPVEVIGKGEGDGAVSHGVFHSHEGQLWSFHAAFSGKLRDLHIRAYVLEEISGQWQSRGRVGGDGLWPLQKPMKLPNGNWIMSCLRVGQGTAAAVAISHGDDFTRWDPVIIPRVPGKMWGESALVRDGDRLINIARYGEEALALVAVSHDWGRTWTPSQPSNLPMATSKPYAGRLSTGQPYLICTTASDTGTGRNPLTIAVGEPGGATFTRVLALDRRDKTSLMYPGADEYQGKLYVGYTMRPHGGTDAPMLAVVPVGSLTGAALAAQRATAVPQVRSSR